MNNNSIHDLHKLGLNEYDINTKFASREELIDIVASSGYLYYKSLSHILLCEIRQYLDLPVQMADPLKQYFPKKNRELYWSCFKTHMTSKFNMPGLRLSVLATVLIVLILLIMISLFYVGIEELTHLNLSGLDLSDLLYAFFAIPIGLIIYFCSNKLPGKTVEDLIGKIIEINAFDLLSDEKKNLKEILNKQLSSATN